MTTLVFCLEEPSAREMLIGLLPNLLPSNISYEFIVFEGKQDMEKRLSKRIQHWRKPDTKFLVMRDQDSAPNCSQVKKKLTDLCQNTGKTDFLIRIACHELESFYLGDLEAVEKGLGIKGLAKKQTLAKFRSPDTLGSPSEELIKLTDQIYQKVSGSRAIGAHLKLNGNKSHSFEVLVSGIQKLLTKQS